MGRWALVVRRSGASPVPRVAAALGGRGLTVAGFAQEPVERDGERTGYDVQRLGHADQRRIGRRAPEPVTAAECSFCSMVFDEDAFAAARGWLAQDGPAAQVVVLDAISKLEAAGRGYHDCVRDALDGPALPVLSVRAEQLYAVMERFGLGEPVASFESEEPAELARFADAIVAATRGRSA